MAHHRDALLILERSGNDDAVRTARHRRRLGGALQQAGAFADARRIYGEALDELAQALGPDHPEVATTEHGLGSLALEDGRMLDARRHFERALAVYEAAFGSDSVRLADSLAALAHCDLVESDFASAARLGERAWALQRELPARHPDRSSGLAVLAVAHSRLGELARSLAEHEELLRELDGRASSAQLAGLHQNLGWLLCHLDRCVEARTHFERVAIHAPPGEPVRDYAESGLAMVELAEGRPRAAIERAARLRDVAAVVANAELVAEVDTTLARARARVDGDGP